MQHSRPPTFPPFFSSFKSHRSGIDQTRFRVNLTLPKPLAVPIWASLPTPPMSGTPPREQPPELPQIAGRRRKRSETPPPHPAVTVVTPPTPLEQSAQGGSVQATRSGQPIDIPGQQTPYTSVYPQPPLLSYGAGSSMGLVTTSPPDTRYAPGQISPRNTRKTKAHVASACVNCKKKHLRCDNARPCRRCVQSGKEDSCKDVEHKKRGRPPLRPDEPSRRAFDPALHPLIGQPTDPSRRMPTADPSTFAQSSYPRTFRPLQAQPSYDPGRTQMRPPSAYPMYAQPSISPSQATATGSFIGPSRSFMGSSMQGAQPLSSYPSPYAYMSPHEQMGMPQQPYSNPIFPREPLPPPQGPSMGYGSSLQLPPIRPAPERSPIDPALSQQHHHHHHQQTQPQGQPGSTGTTREPDSKRPKMDIQGILGPRND